MRREALCPYASRMDKNGSKIDFHGKTIHESTFCFKNDSRAIYGENTAMSLCKASAFGPVFSLTKQKRHQDSLRIQHVLAGKNDSGLGSEALFVLGRVGLSGFLRV